jgi:hypothetical protein
MAVINFTILIKYPAKGSYLRVLRVPEYSGLRPLW